MDHCRQISCEHNNIEHNQKDVLLIASLDLLHLSLPIVLKGPELSP